MAQIFLKDVAKQAGVSVSAASHAVNRTGNLAQSTRDRILKVAEEIGYQRNPALSSIAARRFRKGKEHFARVGFLQLVDPANFRLAQTSFKLHDLILQQGGGFGLQIEALQLIHTRDKFLKTIDRWCRQGFDAVLITDSDLLDWIDEADLSSMVVMGLEDLPDTFAFDRVERDWGNSVRVCRRMLERKGCRRVGAILHPEGKITTQDRIRLGAFFSEFNEPLLTPFQAQRSDLHRPFPIRDDRIEQELIPWLEESQVDGLITWPLHLYYAAEASGIPSLKDFPFAYIRVDEDNWYNQVQGVQWDEKVLAYETVRLIYDAIIHGRKGKPDHPHIHRIQGRWREALE